MTQAVEHRSAQGATTSSQAGSLNDGQGVTPDEGGTFLTACDRWRDRLGRLGFGGTGLGNLFTAVSDADAEAAVATAFDHGVRYFDTAPYYGYGLSEERLGRMLPSDGDSVAVSTKVGRVLVDVDAEAWVDEGYAVSPGRGARFDYSRDGVRRSVDESLKRLARDRIDILYLHDIGRLTHGTRHAAMFAQALDEALPAMADLKAAGVCQAIGIGVNEEEACLDVMARFPLDVVLLAGRYTLLEQATSAGVMALAERSGTGIVIGGPYNSGILAAADKPRGAYDYAPPGDLIKSRAEAIYACAHRFGVDPGAAALQFPLAHPAVVSVVAGMRSRDEAVSAAERMASAIPPSFWEALRAEGLMQEDAPTP